MLRFAVVTDIHYGFDQGSKKGAQAPRLIERFIKRANDNRVDFSVDLGDRITYKNRDSGRACLTRLKEHFNKLAAPHYSIHGNHDLGHLTREENEEILGSPRESYSRDIKGIHFVFWSPHMGLNAEKRLDITDDDLTWLRDDLALASLPCIVFSHVPLDNRMQEENAIDVQDPPRWYPFHYLRGKEVRDIMEGSGKVRLCMSGHLHTNRHREINGIHYIVHQSLTQKNPNTGHARGAYSIVEINSNEIRIEGFGVGQNTRVLPFPKP